MATVEGKTIGAHGTGRGHGSSASSRLRGWKEIGRYFGVTERTVKRWEATRGLPVHRMPGEPRAPVFAYADELSEWMRQDPAALLDSNGDATDAALAPGSMGEPQWRGRAGLLLAGMLALLIAGAAWLFVTVQAERQVADARVEDLKGLAGAQVAALNDQLDSQPGTVAVRSALAKQAVDILGEVAALPDSNPALRRDAAEGYRRLAVLQNAIDRPSLRDRAAARASLGEALKLLEGDSSEEAGVVRARVQIEMARQAAGGGAVQEAERLLQAARPVALSGNTPALADDWWLGQGATLGWKGDYAGSAAAARKVSRIPAEAPVEALARLKALDVEAEAAYYLDELARARTLYADAVSKAKAASARWPGDTRLRWELLRQQWNLGSTLVAMQQPAEAAPMLAEALAGWEALARADPSDEALRAWVRVTRLSYGQALAKGRDFAGAVPVLSEVLAERQAWQKSRPEDVDRRRMLLKGTAALADALADSGRAGEACALYAEGDALIAEMERAGQLTGYDREETVLPLKSARTRTCL